MKKSLAILLVVILCLSLCGCGKSESLVAAENAVKAIGEVTLNSEESINAAEKAINALGAEDREKFKYEDEFEEAKAEYKRLVSEKNAADVETAIDEMGEATIDNLESINDAQKKYDALSSDEKELVSNYNVLESAQETLAAAKKEKARELLSTMKLEEDRVRQYKFYYPKGWRHYSDGWAADIKCFVLPYIGASNDDVWLRMVCNYTADDWIFFEKITFSVDGKNYYKSFQYNDVVRDNANGDIWEYVDMDVNNTELEILKAIAYSNETIVRFEGDDYYDDMVVSAEDKQGIKDALKVYELLK